MNANLYKVEFTDENNARQIIRYVARDITSVSDWVSQFGSDIVITSIGRVNVLQ